MIRRLLWTLLILVAALMLVVRCAQAQGTWGVNAAVSSSGVPVGTTTTITVGVTPSVTVNAVVHIVLTDPAGNTAANNIPAPFTAGHSLNVQWAYAPAATAVNGLYQVGIVILDAAAAMQLAQPFPNVTSFTVVGGVTAVPSTPPVTTPPPPAVVDHKPPCMPKILQWPLAVAYGLLPDGTSTRYTVYGGWLCQTPTGFSAVTYELSPTAQVEDAVLRFMAGMLSPADAAAMIAAGIETTPMTPTEQAFADAQLAGLMPVIKVAFNPPSTTRPVYTANADGTLNPSAVAGELVAVADPCDPRRQLAGTQYFSVAGRPNVGSAGSTLPAGSYTICVITRLPFGVN